MLNADVARRSSEQVATIDARGWQLLLRRGLTGEALSEARAGRLATFLRYHRIPFSMMEKCDGQGRSL